MAEPVQRTVGGRLRYVSCLRFAPRESDGSYREVRERAILYVDGRSTTWSRMPATAVPARSMRRSGIGKADALERDDFSSNVIPLYSFCLGHDLRANASRLSRGKPVPPRIKSEGMLFPDHAQTKDRAG